MQIVIVLILSVVSHRIGVMLFDFFSYGQVFGGFKLWVAQRIDYKIVNEFTKNRDEKTKSEMIVESIGLYDLLSNRKGGFLLSLLNCVFCTTVWVSLIIGLIGIVFINIPIYSIIIIPVLAYWMTEYKKIIE